MNKRESITLDEISLHDYCIQFMSEENYHDLKVCCKPELNK